MRSQFNRLETKQPYLNLSTCSFHLLSSLQHHRVLNSSARVVIATEHMRNPKLIRQGVEMVLLRGSGKAINVSLTDHLRGMSWVFAQDLGLQHANASLSEINPCDVPQYAYVNHATFVTGVNLGLTGMSYKHDL